MAINPLSSALTGASLPDTTPAPKQQTQSPPPSLQQLQALEGAAADPLLSDTSTDTTDQQEDPLLGFSSMTGDPLLDDLNALDQASIDGSNSANPSATVDAALNQDLTSFFMQQATGFYNASQLLGTIDPSAASALGDTTA